jgi:hypothetical protein
VLAHNWPHLLAVARETYGEGRRYGPKYLTLARADIANSRRDGVERGGLELQVTWSMGSILVITSASAIWRAGVAVAANRWGHKMTSPSKLVCWWCIAVDLSRGIVVTIVGPRRGRARHARLWSIA